MCKKHIKKCTKLIQKRRFFFKPNIYIKIKVEYKKREGGPNQTLKEANKTYRKDGHPYY
jgi:anaerobic ribonucleoside-triphosphate reductase